MSDATCYESHLRYPTDIKLMWECCDWLHALLHKICREVGERLPRSNTTMFPVTALHTPNSASQRNPPRAGFNAGS